MFPFLRQTGAVSPSVRPDRTSPPLSAKKRKRLRTPALKPLTDILVISIKKRCKRTVHIAQKEIIIWVYVCALRIYNFKGAPNISESDIVGAHGFGRIAYG